MVKTDPNLLQKAHAFPNKREKTFKKLDKAPKKSGRRSYLHVDTKKIANKMKRQDILFKKMRELKKIKKTDKVGRQKAVKEGREEKLQPLTIEDKRSFDETVVTELDDEVLGEEEVDEFAEYFKENTTPKILMTTSEKPSGYMFDFLKEVKTTFPNCFYWPRKNYTLQEICQYAPNKGYTDIMVWRENQKEIYQLVLIHLPKGPTATFKVSSIKLNKDIGNHGNPTDHFPELILNGFATKIGRRIARFFAALYPQRPEFKGRRVCTFHNQRDFIFFRHHRYMFKEESNRVNPVLQEIGPQFTLKLEKIQHGTFDNTHGELEWNAKDSMYESRTAAFL